LEKEQRDVNKSITCHTSYLCAANTHNLIGPVEKIPEHLPIFHRTSEMLAFIPDIQLFSESNQMVKTDQKIFTCTGIIQRGALVDLALQQLIHQSIDI